MADLGKFSMANLQAAKAASKADKGGSSYRTLTRLLTLLTFCFVPQFALHDQLGSIFMVSTTPTMRFQGALMALWISMMWWALSESKEKKHQRTVLNIAIVMFVIGLVGHIAYINCEPEFLTPLGNIAYPAICAVVLLATLHVRFSGSSDKKSK
eukprot:gnl/Hemi2/22367_TR7450_c0_g1_i1.p1 gnl/Hemi2/22367_TR7450_c0_g1~~gnl/Hemi2/22367_TR7450_c0_g1_i1.p1  ORF type:complete len:173 (-),score=71.64 gnl/Hemi2/22367_TR7450_c0_g1_i1:149-610(-)